MAGSITMEITLDYQAIFYHQPPHIIFGKKSTIEGNKAIKKATTNIAIKKGIIPLNISTKGISLATPATAKTFNPIGGVMRPASIMSITMTPNQIGSN